MPEREECACEASAFDQVESGAWTCGVCGRRWTISDSQSSAGAAIAKAACVEHEGDLDRYACDRTPTALRRAAESSRALDVAIGQWLAEVERLADEEGGGA